MLFGIPLSAVPWLDALGLYLFIAGFIIGLGAVTVIDMHGFLGRHSAYWTEATTRTHKVTKPLIWLGTILAVIGGVIFYRDVGWTPLVTLQAVIAGLLVLNGLFLSFRVSPFLLKREAEGRERELLPDSWQRKITASFLVSFTGWWGGLFLLVFHLVAQRV
jgi:hypothetical protein